MAASGRRSGPDEKPPSRPASQSRTRSDPGSGGIQPGWGPTSRPRAGSPRQPGSARAGRRRRRGRRRARRRRRPPGRPGRRGRTVLRTGRRLGLGLVMAQRVHRGENADRGRCCQQTADQSRPAAPVASRGAPHGCCPALGGRARVSARTDRRRGGGRRWLFRRGGLQAGPPCRFRRGLRPGWRGHWLPVPSARVPRPVLRLLAVIPVRRQQRRLRVERQGPLGVLQCAGRSRG